jgi:hypothetical protein
MKKQDDNNYRKEFLINMYNQMFNDINRHIIVIWQAISVVIGSIAIFALIEKDVLALDYAVSIVILLCFWSIATLIDSGYWYNRNLVIIANIERQFLNYEDTKEIHYYFGKHRKFSLIFHIKIQLYLICVFAGLFLIYHLEKRDFNIFGKLGHLLPLLVAFGGIIYSFTIYKRRKKAYKNFLKYSPGKFMDEKQMPIKIKSESGHPVNNNNGQ